MVGGKSSIGSEASILGAPWENGWYSSILKMANASGLCVRDCYPDTILSIEGKCSWFMSKGWVHVERTIILKTWKWSNITTHINSMSLIGSVYGIL